MDKAIEVEFKYQMNDQKQVQDFLSKLTSLNKKRVVDIYLDTQAGDLYKKGIFIRIRNDKKLDFKFNVKEFEKKNTTTNLDHSHCDELSYSLPLTQDALKDFNDVCHVLSLNPIQTPSLEEFKQVNNLIESIIIDKERTTYSDGTLEYMIDEVANLGTFLEVEQLAHNENEVQKIKDNMTEKLKDLDLMYINTGYCELYWRKHNFELYLQGPYLLDEDFEKYRKK